MKPVAGTILTIIASALAAIFSLCSGWADDLPAPRGAFRELRFSPNGQYVMAQDEREITVLTAQPFAILFRIPAAHADVAKFTPDSAQLNFVQKPANGDPEK